MGLPPGRRGGAPLGGLTAAARSASSVRRTASAEGPSSRARSRPPRRPAPAGEEETLIRFDRATGRLTVDCGRSSLDVAVDRPVEGALLPLAPDEPLRLRAFLDRSVLEVFANGRLCISERIYPSRPDSLGLALFAEGMPARLLGLDVWPLAPIWPDAA